MSEHCSLYCFHYISSLLLQSEFIINLATDTNVSTVSLWSIEYKDMGLIIFIMKIVNFNRNYSTHQNYSKNCT